MWRALQFDVLFKGDDWKGTEKGGRLDRDFAAVGVEVVYLPRMPNTSSTVLRAALRNINQIGERFLHGAQASSRGNREHILARWFDRKKRSSLRSFAAYASSCTSPTRNKELLHVH
ncbi:hypothetical protein J7E70_26280 [Variovorax paradoxus]|nr:hypothetical protein [Variovorax paradoxus]MBT2303955.1 hypothetical protein [Variovorax paradoxus]